MFQRTYLGLGLATTLIYASTAFLGWEIPSGPRGVVPPSVRSTPGGFRSYHHGSYGYFGGK